MEAWKVMLATSGILLGFAVIASITNVSLTGPTAAAIVVVVGIASVVLYVTMKHGYQLGRKLGENMGED
ncbi:hypothetical protein [Halorhabdus salina]|uniref:hypothetical protein n=1 Tax=Halorhabdus salina TaxID=2750670 RepID=UPI0015EEBFF0|nr:hypothetical protein [Halorhabdus salina]